MVISLSDATSYDKLSFRPDYFFFFLDTAVTVSLSNREDPDAADEVFHANIAYCDLLSEPRNQTFLQGHA